MSPLTLNPGLAGLTEGPRFAANYRNQFPGFNNAYRTYALSYDQFFTSSNCGAGLWVLADDAGNGILKTIKGAGIFSYRLRMNRNLYAKMGAEVGIVQSTLHWDKLTFGDQIDDYLGKISPGGTPFPTTEETPDRNSKIYPDLGIGLVVYGSTLYAGLAVRHLNTPDPNFFETNSALTPRMPMRWTLQAGATWRLFRHGLGRNTEMMLSPSFIFLKQGPFSQFNGGILLDAGWASFGLQYRNSAGQSESIIGSIAFKTNGLRIGYSYDATISGFTDGGGTHEVGLVYVIQQHQPSRYDDCLQIFR